MSTRSVAFLWPHLGEELRDALVASGKVDRAAQRKPPLCIIVAPGETALMAVGSGAIYEALHIAYERVEVIDDCPRPGWSTRVLFDLAKSSL